MAEFQRLNIGIALIFCYGLLAMSEGIYVKKHLTNYLELKLVNVVFRHGDRTPVKIYNKNDLNDLYVNYNSYANDGGQLTNIGKMRSYQLGKILRERYNEFLGDTYYRLNVHARSTIVTRAKMTLQLVLAALYPPIGNQVWNPKLLWQPMDVIYVPVDKDNLLFPIACPLFLKDVAKIVESPAVQNRIEHFRDLMKVISTHTGENITSIYDLFVIYQTLEIEKSMGLNLSEWTKDVFPDKFLGVDNLFYELFNYNDDLIRRNGGILLRRIIDDMNKVSIETSSDLKLNLFSGHDINVAALLYALKVFDNQIPEFTSSVILELYAKDNEYFVKILYYPGSRKELFSAQSEMQELKLPDCEVLCPYDKFVQLTSALIGVKEEDACCEK